MESADNAWNWMLDQAGPLILKYGPALAVATMAVLGVCLIAIAGVGIQLRRLQSKNK